MSSSNAFGHVAASGGLGALVAIIVVQGLSLFHIQVPMDLGLAIGGLAAPLLHKAYTKLGMADPSGDGSAPAPAAN
jgi:hypothetical protein